MLEKIYEHIRKSGYICIDTDITPIKVGTNFYISSKYFILNKDAILFKFKYIGKGVIEEAGSKKLFYLDYPLLEDSSINNNNYYVIKPIVIKTINPDSTKEYQLNTGRERYEYLSTLENKRFIKIK